MLDAKNLHYCFFLNIFFLNVDSSIFGLPNFDKNVLLNLECVPLNWIAWKSAICY